MKRIFVYSAVILLFFSHVLAVYSFETQNLNKEVFAKRRQKLMDKMEGGIAVFRADAFDRDFYYLTGFDEPGAACLIIPDAEEKFILFVRPQNPARIVWIGKRYGVEEAVKVFGADKAYPIAQFERILPRHLMGKNRIYCSFNNKELTDTLTQMMRRPRDNWPKQISNILPHVHDMRMIKDSYEIKLMRKAIDITCDALLETMKAAEPGMYEYEIEAIIEYIFRKNGSQRPGFPSIVGSGPNSTILHYDANKCQTQDGDLIVMDVGAEYGHYTADVTRTIPVNGKFNKKQKEIYEIVLEAQQQAIDKIAPGVGIYEVHYRAVEVIKDGLYRLGLITDKESRWQYRVWLMYNTNHWLGLDVHDVGSRGRDDGKGRRLEPGMVFTVEPGIYIGEHSLDSLLETTRRSKARKEDIAAFLEKVKPVFEKYMNIGVRIEDDVLVTEDGHENLSSKAPTTVKEIEKWMKKKSYLNK